MSSNHPIGFDAESETPVDNFLIDVVPLGTLSNAAGLLELLTMLDLEASEISKGASFALFRLLEQSAQAVRHAEREIESSRARPGQREISFDLDGETYDKLRRFAEEDGLSVESKTAEVIHETLHNWFKLNPLRKPQ